MMKVLLAIIIALVLVGCEEESKEKNCQDLAHSVCMAEVKSKTNHKCAPMNDCYWRIWHTCDEYALERCYPEEK